MRERCRRSNPYIHAFKSFQREIFFTEAAANSTGHNHALSHKAWGVWGLNGGLGLQLFVWQKNKKNYCIGKINICIDFFGRHFHPEQFTVNSLHTLFLSWGVEAITLAAI